MDYGFSENRIKRKDKKRNKKRFPYKHGGKSRVRGANGGFKEKL